MNTAAAAAPAAETEKEGKAGGAADNLVEVTAPMVGTFYRAPSPDSRPLLKWAAL